MQIQLITESLTRLLSHSLHPPLTTLCLITPAGQLLASASPLKSSILRSRATLAMSIWELYCENKASIPAALPEQDDGGQKGQGREEGRGEGQDNEQEEESNEIHSITLQLTFGILTVRLLNCGLLVIGLSDSTTPTPSTQNIASASTNPPAQPSPTTSHKKPTSNQGSLRGKGKQDFTVGSPGAVEALGREEVRSSAASDAGSTATVTGRGREVQVVRRRTEMAAKWLEEELKGYKVAEGI